MPEVQGARCNSNAASWRGQKKKLPKNVEKKPLALPVAGSTH
jgi:hypothetical protein